MPKNNYILCFEDFYYEPASVDLNEASQETVKSLQGAKAHFAKRAEQIKKKQAEAAETLNKLKEKGSKTKDPSTQKIHQARGSEESMKQQLYATRLAAVQQAEKIIDQKITIANLRIQSKTKKAAK